MGRPRVVLGALVEERIGVGEAVGCLVAPAVERGAHERSRIAHRPRQHTVRDERVGRAPCAGAAVEAQETLRSAVGSAHDGEVIVEEGHAAVRAAVAVDDRPGVGAG